LQDKIRYIAIYYYIIRTRRAYIKPVASIKIFRIFFFIFFVSFFLPCTRRGDIYIYMVLYLHVYVLPLRALGDRISNAKFPFKKYSHVCKSLEHTHTLYVYNIIISTIHLEYTTSMCTYVYNFVSLFIYCTRISDI